jgi:hypothetical protein
MSRTRPHDVLGLAPGADRAAIESAYRRLIKQYHPDRAGGDPEAAKAVIHAYRELTRKNVHLPVQVEAPPPRRRARGPRWPLLAAVAGGLLLWLLPTPAFEKAGNSSSPVLSSPKGGTTAERMVSAEVMPRVAPDGAAVEAGIDEARRLGRQSQGDAVGYSRSCAADLDRLPSDAMLDHCLAFDMAAANGGSDLRWAADAMAARHRAAAQAVLGDEVLAAARVRAVRLQVERTLVVRR